MIGQRHSQPTPTSWGQGVCVIRFNLHFWQYDRVFFYVPLGNTGLKRTPNKSQHIKFAEKKISSRFCRDSNWQPFDRESGAHTDKLSQLPANTTRSKQSVLNMSQYLHYTYLQLTKISILRGILYDVFKNVCLKNKSNHKIRIRWRIIRRRYKFLIFCLKYCFRLNFPFNTQLNTKVVSGRNTN